MTSKDTRKNYKRIIVLLFLVIVAVLIYHTSTSTSTSININNNTILQNGGGAHHRLKQSLAETSEILRKFL